MPILGWPDRREFDFASSRLFDLGGQLGVIMGSEIAGDHFGHATVNPTSKGRPWDVQLGKEIPISGFADCLLDSVVVGPSRVESFHLECIGRRLQKGGTARKCPVLSRRWSCNASGPECREKQQGYMQGAAGIGRHFLRIHASPQDRPISIQLLDDS